MHPYELDPPKGHRLIPIQAFRQRSHIRDVGMEHTQNPAVKIRMFPVVRRRGEALIEEHNVALRGINVNDILLSPEVVCGVVCPKYLVAIDPIVLQDHMDPSCVTDATPSGIRFVVAWEAKFLEESVE
jgi:hypothetical protein